MEQTKWATVEVDASNVSVLGSTEALEMPEPEPLEYYYRRGNYAYFRNSQQTRRFLFDDEAFDYLKRGAKYNMRIDLGQGIIKTKGNTLHPAIYDLSAFGNDINTSGVFDFEIPTGGDNG